MKVAAVIPIKNYNGLLSMLLFSQTIVCVPTTSGVVELGSTDLVSFCSSDFLVAL